MIEINWKRDYKGEFCCPNCNKTGLQSWGRNNADTKRRFRCSNCKQRTSESCEIKFTSSKAKSEINWRADYKIGEFACPDPNCDARYMLLMGTNRNNGKKTFRCKVCRVMSVNSLDLKNNIIARFGQYTSFKPFLFEDDIWDLRAVVSSFNNRQSNMFFVNFENVQLDWFRLHVKEYTYYLAKINKPLSTITSHLTSLRIFSYYLAEKNIIGINEINRNLILDFMSWDWTGRDGMRYRLGILRNFFLIGKVQEKFEIDQDIIRDTDFPKRIIKEAEPLSDTVREQIEKNLHKLPEPIARMWIIASFTAMRPNELALLKKDCLIQEGERWKIVWYRQKSQDQHEVPITRIIAKVIQEQLEYIENLWKNDWEYLFCHYQGFSKANSFHLDLKPIKKLIDKSRNPLTTAIRSLIKTEDIRDDNGELAKFSFRLVRPTRLTQLFEQGHDLAVVSAWAGHKQLITTALHYTHVSCDLIQKEAGHIQKALLNSDGQYMRYETLPKTFWENPYAHQLELPGDHINTPIYGYCGLPLEQACDKFRACYTCSCFLAIPEKLPLYIKTRDELRAKEFKVRQNGADVLVEQYQRQADQLDKIIARLEGAV
jgi:integrase